MSCSKEDWIRVICGFGTNDKKWQYIDRTDIAAGIERLKKGDEFAGSPFVSRFRRTTERQISLILKNCEEKGISVITYEDELYPDFFREIYNPPAVIFVSGDPKNIALRPSVAIVGARNVCEYSAKVASFFAGTLAKKGVNIVSGFAVGVDSAAHSGALFAGGKTTAFLGSGIMCDYPKGTFSIKKKIAQNGAVVSEYPPNCLPARENFKYRNRLIAAASDCVIVVQAGQSSGALNTVSHALDQGKEVFVVPPHDILSPAFVGQSELIADGAECLTSPKQIFTFLDCIYR